MYLRLKMGQRLKKDPYIRHEDPYIRHEKSWGLQVFLFTVQPWVVEFLDRRMGEKVG